MASDDVEVIKGGSKKQPEQARAKPTGEKGDKKDAAAKPADAAPATKPATGAKPAAAAPKPATPNQPIKPTGPAAATKSPQPEPEFKPKKAGPREMPPGNKPKHVPRAPADPNQPMRKLRISKITVNIGVGQSGDRLEKAEKVLATLTSAKPVRTVARKSIRDWNVREGQPIGVKVTLRGDNAISFAKRALWTRNNRVANWSFDKEGNLLFGVPDHTSFEGQKYNPEIGIFGMDIAVTVDRPGFRIKHRRLVTRKVSPRHRVDRVESQEFLKQLLGLEIV